MANEVAKKDAFTTNLIEALTDAKTGLPADFNIDRFAMNSIAAVQGNKDLMAFAKNNKDGGKQILNNLVKGAYLNLDYANSEFHMIPFGSSLQFIVDYRGDEKLCKKYSIRPIKDIFSQLVREGDVFEPIVDHGEQTINFKPIPFNSGEVIGAFACCLYQDGGCQYEVMSKAELENTRNQSKAKNSPAWTKFTGEMYRKTVLHRLCKHINIDFANAFQRDAFNEGMEIETDIEKVVENVIEENANKQAFEPIDVEASEQVQA